MKRYTFQTFCLFCLATFPWITGCQLDEDLGIEESEAGLKNGTRSAQAEIIIPSDGAAPKFQDITSSAGLDVYSVTFGAVFSDIDNDGDDDLLVSRHAKGPALYLNQGKQRFTDATAILPFSWGDRHGMTVADLDNDGDRDIVLSCGGADGTGPGCNPVAIKNLHMESGAGSFENVWFTSGLAGAAKQRSRDFLPIKSRDGSQIDLYLTNKRRRGYPNLIYRNMSKNKLFFEPSKTPQPAPCYSDEGMDAFADVDRDGIDEFINIFKHSIVIIGEGPDNVPRERQKIQAKSKVSSLAVGDLNNDGYPDLYVGTSNGYSRTDLILASSKKIHFHVNRGRDDLQDRMTFHAQGEKLHFDLVFKPGILPNTPDDIYLGKSKENPSARVFSISKAEAKGAPVVELAGTYIWHDSSTDEWNVVWHFKNEKNTGRGAIRSTEISDLKTYDTETEPSGTTRDLLLMNQKGQFVPWPDAPTMSHSATTAACTFADFNNDGLMDIIGIRRRGPQQFNGDPFVVLNRGKGRLEIGDNSDLLHPEDNLYQADQLIAGDIDEDGRLDLFFTNGWGLRPGNTGPYRLFLNTTSTSNTYVSLSLVGRQSNRDAIGAQVELWGGSNHARVLLGYRELGSGFNRSQSSRKVHFGIGEFSGPLQAKIRWPAGGVSEHKLTAGAIHRIEEPPNQ